MSKKYLIISITSLILIAGGTTLWWLLDQTKTPQVLTPIAQVIETGSEMSGSSNTGIADYAFKNDCLGIGIRKGLDYVPGSGVAFFGDTSSVAKLRNKIFDITKKAWLTDTQSCGVKYGLLCDIYGGYTSINFLKKGDMRIYASARLFIPPDHYSESRDRLLIALQKGNSIFFYQSLEKSRVDDDEFKKKLESILDYVDDIGPSYCNQIQSNDFVFEKNLEEFIRNKNISKDGFVPSLLNEGMDESGVVMDSKYPGCNESDIKLGGKIWSACDVGSNISGKYGEIYIWGNNQPSWKDESKGYWKEEDRGPCAVGYHIPIKSDWDNIYNVTVSDNGSGALGILKLSQIIGTRYWESNPQIIYDVDGYGSIDPRNSKSGEFIRCVKDTYIEGTGSVSFSHSQVSEILTKIDENMKGQLNREKNNTGILIQGEFKAEYITPKDYAKDTDKIIVTLSGAKYELPGIYGEKERLSYIKCLKEDVGSGKYTKEQGIGFCAPSFAGFKEFSPRGSYLLIGKGGWEYGELLLIDIKTGKTAIGDMGFPVFHTWTKDKKQFIYGGGSEMGGRIGLFITKSDNFPETVKLSDNFIDGGYIDNDYTYVISHTYDKEKESKYLKIYDLKTLKEVFSQEIK